ncbi:histidine kinase dimerization/phosphoacceptor domain -containing protein [Mucilaginibacter angelicae]|uniref:histidine kinase n=1 Tax=Mucilaginibacter angelicae TaxID=869718 RepID=A0ABV6KZZ6_9SPHI
MPDKKMHSYFYGAVQRKICFSLVLIAAWSRVQCQTDLKNSLNDLKTQFVTAKSDSQKTKLALTIGSFYLTNKVSTKAMRDSSRSYLAIAEALNNTSPLKDGSDAVKMLKLRILLLDNQAAEADKMIAESSGALYCKLHFLAGRYFLEKPGEEKADLDLAGSHFLSAQHYADKKGMPNISLINQAYFYNLMVERGIDETICNKYFDKILALCRAYKSKRVEIKLLQNRAINDLNHHNLPGYMIKTAAEARAGGEIAVEIFCLKEIADYNLRQGRIDSAEQQLNTVLKMYKALGYKNLQFTYDLLAGAALAKGNMEKGMRYSLATVKAAEETGTDHAINLFYNRLAGLCRDLGLKRQSLMWYRKWQEAAMRSETSFPYAAYSALANELISQGKARQVLKTLDSAARVFKFDANGMFLIPQLKADCYVALGKTDSAEFYNFSIIKNLENRGMKDYLYYQAYQNQAAFYIKQKKFEKASPFVEIPLNAGMGVVRAVDMAILQKFKFKIDSARGNYLSAINHFQASKNISDSIYNHVRVKQTEQLQLQYATAERDHENLILRNRNNLQRSELEKEGLNRKLISIALLGSVFVTGLTLYLYRAKQKNNKMLQIRQEEINKQNIQLSQLLQEKQWLMKEIHHRVKNNLQIISSLLNTQSSFLDNEQAITAIRDSQNRMQAISIVHQKLYQSDDLATVSLPVYIEDLARNIQDSFQTRQHVQFEIDITEAQLNTAQSVPLGLILNETITNSVKYAFTETEVGVISLSSSISPDNYYELEIRDNGRGLPEDFDIDSCTSLGMNLISGLTAQLGGRLDIRSEKGAVILVAFPL